MEDKIAEYSWVFISSVILSLLITIPLFIRGWKQAQDAADEAAKKAADEARKGGK